MRAPLLREAGVTALLILALFASYALACFNDSTMPAGAASSEVKR